MIEKREVMRERMIIIQRERDRETEREGERERGRYRQRQGGKREEEVISVYFNVNIEVYNLTQVHVDFPSDKKVL